MNDIPVVTIVGRQNVGKSSLLNAMAKRRISIVDPMPGVTRDRVTAIIKHKEVTFELVDTGGLGLDRQDRFHDAVGKQISTAIDAASVIIMLVDIQEGITPLDEEIVRMVRQTNKETILVANKADNPKIAAGAAEFFRFGLGDVHVISAVHRRGVPELMDKIVEKLTKLAIVNPPTDRDIAMRIAIVGKRNVGKSTLVNSLAMQERVIVSEHPGTTRDSVDVIFERDGERWMVIDTAGVRKRQKVEHSVELFSMFRTEEAIRRTDIVLFIMDVETKVTQIDKSIAALVEASLKPCIVVLNKWDKVGNKAEAAEFVNYLNATLPIMIYAPLMFISAKTGFNIWEILKTARDLDNQSKMKIPTPKINKAIEQLQNMYFSPRRGVIQPRIYYATQVGTKPQRLLLFVNDATLFTPQHIRTIENHFRKVFPIHEVPLRIIFRNRQRKRVEDL